MSAAALAQVMGAGTAQPREIVLVESPDIGTIGVGEATLPTIRFYNEMLGLDPHAFVAATQATFKLGIEFKDWGHVGNRFFHGFGGFGPAIQNRSPHHFWLQLQRGGQIEPFEDWSTASVMARCNRFRPPMGEQPSASNAYSYAYHFDAGLYAAHLREYAVQRGVQRVEGTVDDVALRPIDGFVAAVTLTDGRRIDGDLFIDCSGQRALLIGGVLKIGYDDWSAFLPVNSALAVPSRNAATLNPYTTSTARSAGWQWRIPLQHRIGNGHVYCSGFISDAEAERVLLQGLDTEALDAPRLIRFTTGKRRRMWVNNVVAVGLSSGFLEPLESTSIQLIMDGIGRLIELFPDMRFDPWLATEYDRRMTKQYESIRDFIVLHYKLTQRDDSSFWQHMRAMDIPATLAHQIELFRGSGRVAILDADSFGEPSWLSLLLGLGVQPEGHDPMVGQLDEAVLRLHFKRVREAIAATVADMPDHAEYIDWLKA